MSETCEVGEAGKRKQLVRITYQNLFNYIIINVLGQWKRMSE